jgi:hypothetical protein
VVLTYHCDLILPQGFINRLANKVSDTANHISAALAHTIVTNTRDYAENSPFLQRYLSKVEAINPPVELEPASERETSTIKAGISLGTDNRHGCPPGQ